MPVFWDGRSSGTMDDDNPCRTGIHDLVFEFTFAVIEVLDQFNRLAAVEDIMAEDDTVGRKMLCQDFELCHRGSFP